MQQILFILLITKVRFVIIDNHRFISSINFTTRTNVSCFNSVLSYYNYHPKKKETRSLYNQTEKNAEHKKRCHMSDCINHNSIKSKYLFVCFF